jgi:hypothetical protein
MKSHHKHLLIATLLATSANAQAAWGWYGFPYPEQGTWATTLQPRDFNGDYIADAFYDTRLNITWLRDWGLQWNVSWQQATDWATNLTLGGVSGWRLPTMVDTGAPGCAAYSFIGGTDCGHNVQTTNPATGEVYSELADLYFVTLGNASFYDPITGESAYDPVTRERKDGLQLYQNQGDFLWMQSSMLVWTNLEYSPDTSQAWVFAWGGGQGPNPKIEPYLTKSIAVHYGDIGTPVPEPSSIILAGLAIFVVAFSARQKITA